MLKTAFYLSLQSLTGKPVLRAFCYSLLINSLAMAALVGAIWLGVEAIGLPWWLLWLEGVLQWGAMVIAWVLAYLLFPLLLPLIISLYDTRMMQVVERQHYPAIPEPQPPYWPSLWQDARFVIKALCLNLLLLPLYLLPPVAMLAYWLLNSLLLGQEFYRIVAGRHLTPETARKLGRQHRLTWLGAGGMIMAGFALPVVNLMAPVLAIVLMSHLLHRLTPDYKQKR